VSRLSENVTEQLLCGVVTAESAGVAALLGAIRSEFAVTELPSVGAALSEFVDPGAIAASTSTPAFTQSREQMGSSADSRVCPVAAPKGRRRALSGVGAFAGTLVGKIVFGSAVALAVTGGGQALGVIHLPGTGHRHPNPVHVVHPRLEAVGSATSTPDDAPVAGNPRTGEPTLPSVGIAQTPGHDPGNGPTTPATISPEQPPAADAGTPADGDDGLPTPPEPSMGDSGTPAATPAIPHDSATPASDTTTTTPSDQPAPDGAIDLPTPLPDGDMDTTTTTSDTAPPDTGA
jgi:hypothetical protein